MTVPMRSVTMLTISVVTALLTAVHTTAMDFRGMEDNCILSFVVPRDKVKSSCDMEERVRRRLNAMETKVTLYKQHVQELQDTLGKERQVHQQRLEELHQRLTISEANAGDGALEKRIYGLEEELRKIRTLVSSSSASKPQSAGLGEKRGGVGLGMSPMGRSREEEEKALTVLVKTVVHGEVKKLFDNYTHYVGRYVRDQALAFNQIINMVPRHHPNIHSNHLPPKYQPDSGNDLGRGGDPTPQPTPEREAALLNELEHIRNRLNSSGQRLADRMHHALNNNNANKTTLKPQQTTADSKVTPSSTTPPPMPQANGSYSALSDINDTSSGDVNDTATDHNSISLDFTPLMANITDPAERDGSANNNNDLPIQPPNMQSPPPPPPSPPSSRDKDSVVSAKSRMSYNADLNKLPDPSRDSGHEGEEGEEDRVDRLPSNLSGWKESMVHDQSTGQWLQELLRTEVQRLLRQQVDEVVSLVVKHTSMVDSKLHDQQLKFGQLEQRLAADIKHLSQETNGLSLEMSSVSQGLQSLYSRVDGVEELHDTVHEMRKNMSQEGGSRLLATLLDEQGKKVRKMERLNDIYKQSLEHYRNETKLEYRDLKDRLGKEVAGLRLLSADLHRNVTEHAQHLTQQMNTSTHQQMEDIRHRVQVMEDSSVLQQIDLSAFERQLKSKTAKAERDLDRLGEDVGELKQKTRNLLKNLNSALAGQRDLSSAVNASSLKMQHMEIEVKLNVLNEWVPYEFHYMKTRTDCFGDQFIRKSGFKTGRLVGVVLCTDQRYKIFLGQSLTDTFKNIGDDSGMGEDHCQFVNARSMAKVKVSPFRTSTETEPGYVRTHWGQEPRPELLNIIRPSPAWYECGVSIP